MNGRGEVTLTITSGSSHAFPTGDMFRRARLLVFAEDADGRIAGDAERVFTRAWGTAPAGDRLGAMTERSDTRIRELWSETFSFRDAPFAVTRVRWKLLYERPLAIRGDYVSLAASDVVAEGRLEGPY